MAGAAAFTHHSAARAGPGRGGGWSIVFSYLSQIPNSQNKQCHHCTVLWFAAAGVEISVSRRLVSPPLLYLMGRPVPAPVTCYSNFFLSELLTRTCLLQSQ